MSTDQLPWQIEMFRRSIKKQQKLGALLEILGETAGKQCLLVTCGDNNGALNWYFRRHGGQWTWADVSGENNDQISRLLNEPVHAFREDDFPMPDERFDCVVSIDVLEHLRQDQPFLKELKRVLKPGGALVLTGQTGRKEHSVLPFLATALLKRFVRYRLRTFIASRKKEDLNTLREWLETGKIKPVIDRTYPLTQIHDAIRHVEAGHARGKVAVTISATAANTK